MPYVVGSFEWLGTSVNQWNCSDVILRCASPSGGSVTLKFYENGTEVTSASATNGTIYETINCSSEAYQWVSINGTGIKTNAVSCSSP
uniref:C6 domain-containing protein n=1 Tax=Acrobeloides nanus TaxID=290746 RepID=A0A914CB60_9BILA